MHPINKTIALALALTFASGCSTRPRNFSANLSAPVADVTSFERDYRVCQELVNRGHSSNFKGAAVTALASGGAFFGVGTALYGAGAMGISGGAAVASAAVPVIGVLAGFGVSRAIRGGRERKFKRNMSSCLGEYGHKVDGWTKLRRREDAVAHAVSSVQVTPVVQSAPAATPVAEIIASPEPGSAAPDL